jgi:hypothetical protein
MMFSQSTRVKLHQDLFRMSMENNGVYTWNNGIAYKL